MPTRQGATADCRTSRAEPSFFCCMDSRGQINLGGRYAHLVTGPQSGDERYVVLPWWRGRALPWAVLVAVSIVVTGVALERTAFFLSVSDPEFIERLRVGRLVMLGGSATSLAAAVWSQVRGHPLWVTVCVASPAVLVGLATMMMTPPSLAPLVAGAVALPAAVAGLVGGLLPKARY